MTGSMTRPNFFCLSREKVSTDHTRLFCRRTAKTLILIAGNHCPTTLETTFSSLPAPGGWIGLLPPDASKIEIIASGLRNAYDVVLNSQGDLFTCDSDAEQDAGLPWYRPPRFLHAVNGADFGWREGPEKMAQALCRLLASHRRARTIVTSRIGFGTPHPFSKTLQERHLRFGLDLRNHTQHPSETGRRRLQREKPDISLRAKHAGNRCGNSS